MNNLGYEFLYNNKNEEALKVFNLNIRAYPHRWNVYDSMAEAFMLDGENDKAIEYYKKSAEINPDNGTIKKCQ
jgi:Tfp pilus assembly protein PilF